MPKDFDSTEQFPANVAGPQLAGGFFALARIIIGTGGMPIPQPRMGTGTATPTGFTAVQFAGFSATFIGTGTYDIRHPTARLMGIQAQVRAASDNYFVANVIRENTHPGSGIARLQIGQPPVAGGQIKSVNAPSGTMIELLFTGSSKTTAPLAF